MDPIQFRYIFLNIKKIDEEYLLYQVNREHISIRRKPESLIKAIKRAVKHKRRLIRYRFTDESYQGYIKASENGLYIFHIRNTDRNNQPLIAEEPCFFTEEIYQAELLKFLEILEKLFS